MKSFTSKHTDFFAQKIILHNKVKQEHLEKFINIKFIEKAIPFKPHKEPLQKAVFETNFCYGWLAI
jgi:hypothetical protein